MIIFLLIVIAVGVLLISDGGKKILAWTVALPLIATAFLFSKRFINFVFYSLCLILGIVIIGTALSIPEFRDNISIIIAFGFICYLVYKKLKSGDFGIKQFIEKDFIGKVGTIGLALIIPLILGIFLYYVVLNNSVSQNNNMGQKSDYNPKQLEDLGFTPLKN